MSCGVKFCMPAFSARAASMQPSRQHFLSAPHGEMAVDGGWAVLLGQM